MIPPSGAREDSGDGLTREATGTEQPPSPASTSSLESKTKSLRSKSADNFFPRTNSDVKPQADLLAKASPGPSPIPIPGSPASMPTKAGLHPGSNSKVHAFQEHVFKKPTFCDVCNHMIV
ncbi:src homology three (SH3) and cysteine rich domain (predicted), isoform CRA_b, partial [Rattus norvegicus]